MTKKLQKSLKSFPLISHLVKVYENKCEFFTFLSFIFPIINNVVKTIQKTSFFGTNLEKQKLANFHKMLPNLFV